MTLPMDKQKRAKELLAKLKELKKQLPTKGASIIDDLLKEVSTSVNNQIADGPILKKIQELELKLASVQHVDVANLSKSFQEANDKNESSFSEYSAGMEERLAEIISKFEESGKKSGEKSDVRNSNLLLEIKAVREEFRGAKEESANRTSLLEAEVSRVTQLLEKTKTEFATNEGLETAVTTSVTVSNNATDELKKLIKDLEQSTQKRISAIANTHGGNANRNIAIGGNTSVLSRYTDINLKAGTNVTLSYAHNDTTKYTDLTISASGSGGAGITRSVNTVAVNTAAGAVAATDYVYLASGTLNITLPTSVGNSNLYTVKNIGAGTVTILTTGGETIDGSANLILPLQFTSVDLISNNSGNWDIT